MPQEIGYTRQVTPQAGAPRPLADPEQYGAGFGRTLEAAAGQLHREQLQDYQLQRDQTANAEWAQFQRAFAEHRLNMSTIAREARKDGSPGHTARMATAYDAAREALIGSITEDKVRQQAAATFDNSRASFLSSEGDFELVAGVNRTLANEAETQTLQLNQIRRGEAKDFPGELELGEERIRGYHLPADQEAKALREWHDSAGVASLRGMIDRDPQLAIAAIDGGLYDFVDPDKLDVLKGSAEVELRRADAAAQQAAALAKADFRERVRVVQAHEAGGEDVSEELPALIEEAGKMGLPDVAAQLTNVAVDARLGKVYESQTPVQREGRMRALEAKGDKRTAEEDRELKWLEDHQGGLDGKFKSDPAGFFARNGAGSAPPALDWQDPASIKARAQWAAAASAASGYPVPPLTKNEADQLGAHWATGKTNDQRIVIDALAQLPGEQAAAAARMVDPSDPRLAVMVTLGPNTRNLALTGRDVLKANPKLLHTDDARVIEAMKEYDDGLAEALHVFPANQRAAIKDVAARILAGLVDQNGGELTGDRYRQAVNMAIGAQWTPDRSKQLGGIATWGEHWFMVPPGMHKDEFAPAVGRAAARMSVKPVNPDGSPANLSRAYPVAIGGGQYEFHTADGAVVMGSNKQPWRVRVAK